MPWWRRRKADDRAHQESPSPAGEQPSGRTARDAERRYYARLLQRRAALQADLAEAEQAMQPENRWTERIRELEAALAELDRDLAMMETSGVASPPSPLPAIPVKVMVDLQRQPATVEVEVAGERFAWVEEVDWAERGHQLAPARLVQVQGDLENLGAVIGLPQADPQLREVLGASLDTLAVDALEAARYHRPWVPVTLTDLARPCQRCGGWTDLRGRCSTCAARDWQRQQLLLERNRLRRERDELFRDWQQTRDRLPVIRRQLAEVEAELAALRAKGIDALESPHSPSIG